MESSSPTGKSVISRDLILVQFTCSVEKHSSIRWTAVKDVVFLHLGTRSRKTTTARHRKIGFPGALWPPQSFFWSKAGWRALLLCLCANHCSLSVTQPPAPDPSNSGKHKKNEQRDRTKLLKRVSPRISFSVWLQVLKLVLGLHPGLIFFEMCALLGKKYSSQSPLLRSYFEVVGIIFERNYHSVVIDYTNTTDLILLDLLSLWLLTNRIKQIHSEKT